MISMNVMNTMGKFNQIVAMNDVFNEEYQDE